MTDEQIKQNAEAYAELLTAGNKEHYRTIYTAAKEGYETGAHSRDEEIDRLNDKLSKQAMLLEERGLIRFSNLNAQLETENACMKYQIEELSDQLKMNAENIQKLRNPWISVEERLPDIKYQSSGESVFVFVHVVNKDTGSEWLELPARYNEHIHDWQANDFTWIGFHGGVVTHWMPIPKLTKGNNPVSVRGTCVK